MAWLLNLDAELFRLINLGLVNPLFDAVMPYQLNIDVAGTEGTLRDNRIWSRRLMPGQTTWTTMGTPTPDSGDVQHHPFDAEFKHLVDSIREGRPSHCTIADAYHTHEICLAIDRSLALGGQPVRLPLEGD